MYKGFRIRMFGVLMAAVLSVVFTTPVQAAEGDELLELISPDTIQEIESESTEFLVPLGNETIAEDDLIQQFDVFDENALDSEEVDTFDATLTKLYNQPMFYVNDDYDAMQFFVTDSGKYVGKAYFVIIRNPENSSEKWMLYNYLADTAKVYFYTTEMVSGMYVPSVWKDSRPDIESTSYIDESKVPTMSLSDYHGMYCNWRNFTDIPFTRDSNGALVYATYTVTTSDDNGGGNGNTDPDNGEITEAKLNQDTKNWYRYSVTTDSSNTWRVYITRSVEYCGQKHVQVGNLKANKARKDISVHVFVNGALVQPSLYTLKFKNNKNCNGYNNCTPYVQIKLQLKNPAFKADKKYLSRLGFGFDITPVDLSKGMLTCTAVKTTKKGIVKLVNAKFTTSNNVVIDLKARGNNLLTGDYFLTLTGTSVVVNGVNNFTGTCKLQQSSGIIY